MGTKKITIAHKRGDCIGCGSCALICPERWSMNDEDGKADLKGGEKKGDQFTIAQIDEHEVENNQEAADACPMRIIRIGW